MKLVAVTWLDAAFLDSGEPPIDRVGIYMTTVGWLLRDDKLGIVLAGERDENGGWRRITEIPRPYIKKVKTLAKR